MREETRIVVESGEGSGSREGTRTGGDSRLGVGPGTLERSEGERSEPQRSGGVPGGTAAPPAASAAVSPPNPEAKQKPVRRQFSTGYKLKILDQVDACKGQGELGELLRREGLYSSYLSTWRRQRNEGTLQGLVSKGRGRKAKTNPLQRQVARLERDNRQLRKRLKKAETIIEIQKKVSGLLGISLETAESSEKS